MLSSPPPVAGVSIQRAIARHLPNGAVFVFDPELRLLFADGSLLFESLGLERGATVGRTIHDIARGPDTVAACQDTFRGDERRLELSRDGRTYEMVTVPIPDDAGTIVAGMALLYDVTERKRELDELRHARELLARQAEALRDLSLVDSLTGISNRRGFLAGAEELRTARRSAGTPHVLLFIDLDGLKDINDVLGHKTGDNALREAAAVLVVATDASDVVARLGGDEFAIFTGSTDSADAVIARIEAGLAMANARPERRFQLSMSIGTVPVASDDTRPLDTLLDLADARMYERKKTTRSSSARQTSATRAA